MNPLFNEYKRSRFRTMVVIVLLAFSAAIIDYFMALNQRISQQQQLLTAAVEDLDHQFNPLFHLVQVLKQDAEHSLAAADRGDESLAAVDLPGSQWPLTEQRQTTRLAAAEVSMLQQLTPKLLHSQRSTLQVRQLSYVSARGIWYSSRSQPTAAQELQSKLYWEGRQQLSQLSRQQIRLQKLLAAEPVYLLSVPILAKDQQVGELVMEFELSMMLKLVAKAQQGASVRLVDETGNSLLLIDDMQESLRDNDNFVYHSDNMKSLSALPITLILEPAKAAAVLTELVDFIGHLMLYLLALTLLFWYSRRRFKNKVLSPFHRLLIHIDLLNKGDPQGVRSVPTEWGAVFQQVEQVRQTAVEVQNKR